MLVLALSFIATFLIFSAALGLRTVEGCDSDTNITRDAQKIQCYYSAAVSAAYLCGARPSNHYSSCSQAISICDQIWTTWENSGDSISKKAELMSNHCFYDVAKITRNEDTCGYIIEHRTVGVELFGDRVTRDMCQDEVERLAQITPENYFEKTDNICTIVFVLPMLLGLAIARRGP